MVYRSRLPTRINKQILVGFLSFVSDLGIENLLSSWYLPSGTSFLPSGLSVRPFPSFDTGDSPERPYDGGLPRECPRNHRSPPSTYKKILNPRKPLVPPVNYFLRFRFYSPGFLFPWFLDSLVLFPAFGDYNLLWISFLPTVAPRELRLSPSVWARSTCRAWF